MIRSNPYHVVKLADSTYAVEYKDNPGIGIPESYGTKKHATEYMAGLLGLTPEEMRPEERGTPNAPKTLYTVAIIDAEAGEEAVLISTFDNAEKAEDFIAKAKDKIAAYGVQNTVRIVRDSGTLNSEEYLGWLDDLYGEG